MNKQKKGMIHIGFSSILMVFTMLCLVTFATLSLITANSDYRLSLKVAEKTTTYYKADAAAREYLMQLDLALADLYAACDDRQTFFEKAAILIPELKTEDTLCAEPPMMTDNYLSCTFQVTISDVQKLYVTLKLLYPEHPGDEFYKVTQWQTVTNNEPAMEDDTLHLYQGNE